MKQKICKCCFKTINNPTISTLFIKNLCLCPTCYHSFNYNLTTTKFLDYNLTYLTTYKKPISSFLIQYKENLDYELKDVFFNYFTLYIKIRYFSYYIVLVPSSKSKLEKRGFNHLKSMCEQFEIPFLDILEKDDTLDQKKKNLNERKNVNKYIHLKNGNQIKGKKILLIDDVLTSGNSLKACINLIKQHNPKKLEILVLCKDVNNDKV